MQRRTYVKYLKELSKAFENFKRDFRIQTQEIEGGINSCSDTCSEVKDAANDIRNIKT